VALLQGNLNVSLPRDSRILSISWESANPAMSARIANAYAEEFVQDDLQRKYDSSAYARKFIADQLTQTRQRLEDSERALNAYSRQAGLIRLREPTGGSSGGESDRSGGGSITTASLVDLNRASSEATARRIAAEGQWQAISGTPLLASPAVLANATVGGLLTQKATVEAELLRERAQHLDEYPAVRAKAQELASLNRQIQTTAENVRTGIRAEYAAAEATEQRLIAQVEKLKGATLNEQDRNVQYALLAREADTNRQVYDGLLQRFKELNASAGISVSNIAIVDRAEAPGAPSSPNLLKNLLTGLLMGAALAGIIVFAKDQFDDAIRVPEDVDSKLDVALLGVIPKAPDDRPIDKLSDAKSAISEAYNSLRGSIMYSTPEGLPHVMLCTSAQANEGKSTTAFAISASFARMGKRVLLIDADMRRPSVSSLLTSQDALSVAVRPSAVPNLDVIPSGPIPPSPTELLSGYRIEALLQEAAAAYDVVMVDSPPVLGLADAPNLAALVDGVLFVVEAGRSRRGALKQAMRRLKAMRPIILGAVLTKFDPSKIGNRYSEYYGYQYYQYGHDEA
jgi:capsular exopolysaccharide synthesis family protein